MNKIVKERVTATKDNGFVVFLIGMRINYFWKIHKWFPIFISFPKMVKELIKNQEATFFARVSGESMINAGLEDGDLIVIDRSIEPANNKIAVCFIDGEFTVKRLRVKKGKIWLQPENSDYKAIEIKEDNELVIWGIVTNVIKKL